MAKRITTIMCPFCLKDIPKKIMKCVDFEIDMVKREVIMDLGKQKYQEMKERK